MSLTQKRKTDPAQAVAQHCLTVITYNGSINLVTVFLADFNAMKEGEKSSRLEMLDEASLTRQPEEVCDVRKYAQSVVIRVKYTNICSPNAPEGFGSFLLHDWSGDLYNQSIQTNDYKPLYFSRCCDCFF